MISISGSSNYALEELSQLNDNSHNTIFKLVFLSNNLFTDKKLCSCHMLFKLGLIKTGGSFLCSLSPTYFLTQVSKDEARTSYSCAFRFLYFIKSPSSSSCIFAATKALTQARMFGFLLVHSITCQLSYAKRGTGVVSFK